VDERIDRLELVVEQLREEVRSLRERLDAVDPGDAKTPAEARVQDPAGKRRRTSASARAERDPYDPIVMLTLIGRLFLVLAGGFFLRAMTEAGVLAAPVGVGLAFLYAAVWLVLADRTGRRGQSSGALLHAIAAALVAYPLLIEATTRFKVVGVAGSVLGLSALTAGFLAVAVRGRTHPVAWIGVVAALPTSAVLMLKTGVAAPFVLFLIGFGVVTVWLAYSQGWTLIRWPVALAADLAVVAVTLRALGPGHPEAFRVVMLLQVLLVGAYLGSIAVRTLVRDHNVTLFEMTQTALVLLVGFGGAMLLTRSAGTLPIVMGVASLVFGAACYALAFRFVGRHADHERNVHFYSSLALVLVLAGLVLDLPGPWLGAVAALFAVVAAWGWMRFGRPDLLLHSGAYIIGAAAATGGLRYAGWALLASPERWALPGLVTVGVAVAAALAAYFAAGRPHPDGGILASGLRFALALVLVWLASGCVTGYLASLLAAPDGGAVDLGVLATVRTGVLAGATLCVAAAARRGKIREWAWLVYPLLVFIGLKMVAQDFKYSRPATLFIALALFGLALIVAPRLKRGVGQPRARIVEA
jgi:hypothetical protein